VFPDRFLDGREHQKFEEKIMALYGVYGSHTVEACPVNNLENAKKLVSFAESDPTPLLSKYQIKNVLGQYHSAFEHTFIWIVDAEDPHLIEEFALEAGLTSFNNLTIVPLKSLKEGVIPLIKKVHGL
jgi:hypothetical protein